MASALLLDLLMFLVPVMLIPLGLWRGGPHEGYVGGGLLLGWVMGSAWAGAWAGPVGGLIGLDADTGGFLVSIVLLVAGAGVGHVAGSVVGLPRPEADARIAGAFLAWLNGVLFLTLALAAYRTSLAGRAPNDIITHSFLTEAVLNHGRWVLLVIAIAVLVLIGVVFWVNAAIGDLYDPAYVPGTRTVFTEMPPPAPIVDQELLRGEPVFDDGPYRNWPATARRPVNVPRVADAGKVEPGPSRLRTALSRIGPAPQPERPAPTLAAMFAQTLPVDLRGRAGSGSGSAGSTDGAMPTDRSSRTAGSDRAAPTADDDAAEREDLRIADVPQMPATGAPRETSGDRLSDRLAELPPAGPAARPRMAPGDRSHRGGANLPPSSISEWLRVASGMANPIISEPRKSGNTPRARRAATGDADHDTPGGTAADASGDDAGTDDQRASERRATTPDDAPLADAVGATADVSVDAAEGTPGDGSDIREDVSEQPADGEGTADGNAPASDVKPRE